MKFNPRTYRYTPQLLARKDTAGNVRNVAVRYDNDSGTYVATIQSQRQQRMADGTTKGPIIALGEGRTPEAAADNAIQLLA